MARLKLDSSLQPSPIALAKSTDRTPRSRPTSTKVSKIPFDVPANMARIDEEGPHTFFARIKSHQHLDVFKARDAPFLSQPVAIGNWNGLLCSVYESSGKVQESFRMYTNATWLEFFTELHSERHPTGTHFDVAPEDDDEPGYEWDFFVVRVLLL